MGARDSWQWQPNTCLQLIPPMLHNMSSPANWQKYQHDKWMVLRRNMRPFNYSTIRILSFKTPKRLSPCQFWTQLGHKRRQLRLAKLSTEDNNAWSSAWEKGNSSMMLLLLRNSQGVKSYTPSSIPLQFVLPSKISHLCWWLNILLSVPYVLHFSVDIWSKIPSM